MQSFAPSRLLREYIETTSKQNVQETATIKMIWRGLLADKTKKEKKAKTQKQKFSTAFSPTQQSTFTNIYIK
eukprot:m.113172 g.113172  ORF g.113172 m.113172 type:complete len:72 (+) comp15352_c0_seq1:187-402(+)